MMTSAGVSLASALKSLIKQSQRAEVTELLEEINEDVLGGASLSAALAKRPDSFDPAFTATIAAGEASGKMADVLSQLAELLRSELRLSRTIRGMMVYPVLLTTVSSFVIVTLVLFVLPRFAAIFEQYEIALPFVTTALLGVAEELIQRWWVWGPIAGGLVAGLVALKATPQGRRVVDVASLQIPMLSKVTRNLIGARVCKMMGLLISSGVPLLDCIALLKRAVSNSVFHELADEMEEAVTNGRSLSSALEENTVLPESATEMIATAEKTGRIGEVSGMLGSHYDEEGQSSARQLVSAMEPILTILMGGCVAVVVLAVMLPVFDIASLAQR